MLTNLRIRGFKNLVDVSVRFGPFTCVAGANGTGKSNLFDAIHFLSLLADRPLLDAALCVRDEGGKGGDVRDLFHRVGDRYDDRMFFDAEMIVPKSGEDDLGQPAEATNTFLRYSLELKYRGSLETSGPPSLEIAKEELTHIKLSDAHKHILFPHTASTWRRTAVLGKRRTPYFVSTEGQGSTRVVKLHQDGGSSGRPLRRSASNLPRTILSVVNAAESPTATLARREMQSWRLLQLEPSALRKPSELTAPPRLATDGSNLPATLYHLARAGQERSASARSSADAEAGVYATIANRLRELIDEVASVSVVKDDKRQLLTLHVTDRDGTSHPAMALSDGTLRFLALAVLELDPRPTGLICLEEPENGIHPERIPAMLSLLQDIATDPTEPTGPDNPLSQVIINTHSPAVVGQVTDDTLVVAESKEILHGRDRFKGVVMSCLEGTWRENEPGGDASIVSRGKLLAYLNPVLRSDTEGEGGISRKRSSKSRTKRGGGIRVADRKDLQRVFWPEGETA